MRLPIMTRTLGPILKTILFTLIVPGTVAGLAPYWILGGYRNTASSPLLWTGALFLLTGSAFYFHCAWEFAVRGLGTPFPTSPTKHLVISGLNRYVRNPMYIGVLLAIVGQAIIFHSLRLTIYAIGFCICVELFVLFYEEPTLLRQFGDSYEEYRRAVPRWIPRAPNPRPDTH